MPAFTLSSAAWVQIVAPNTTKDQQVQITSGRAFISLGAPSALSSPLTASTVENKFFTVPAGVEVQARAIDQTATITVGDY